MKPKIVELVIKDYELIGDVTYPNGILDTYYLINPDKEKLEKLKHIVEHRHDYLYEDLTDEAFDIAEEISNNIWDAIDLFINANFIVLDIEEAYEIQY